MFKKILLLIIFFCLIFFGNSNVFAGWDGKNPNQIISALHDSGVQDTALDKGNYTDKGVNGTFNSIKSKSNGYIQWLGFIGLAIALILIIYNGMLLLGNFTGEDKLAKVKKRFLSLILGVIILTSGYVIIKLVMSLISQIFS